ncbi:hypothetical protein [Sorangium cellulosum]|uniref:hypothetical protein n=1 Tax=Sorangium cellulosum TaxID=56 RepID=UPI00133149A0|nr:hypothetical protein [Sorangium cellulosum]
MDDRDRRRCRPAGQGLTAHKVFDDRFNAHISIALSAPAARGAGQHFAWRTPRRRTG